MLYSFGRIKIITRGKGKSSVATAAYHSATKIRNEWDGVTHDYTKKPNVGETYIRMPVNAPQRYIDESISAKERAGIIWNDVEMFEKGIGAQLARQNYLALQDEFTLEQNLECVDRFIEENCTSQGMGVVYTVHYKPQNLHVDMMYLMREFDKDGNFKMKSQKEYLCRNAEGKEKYMNAAAFKIEKENGWEKVYKCIGPAGEERNLTPSQLRDTEGFERKSKYPIDRKVDVNGWNDHELASKWRKSWEIILNEKFEELGLPNRVDCRSYKEQKKEQIPTQHRGWGNESKNMQKLNAQIMTYNQEREWIKNMAEIAIKDAEERVVDLQTYFQSEDELNAHQEALEYDHGMINVIAESELFQEEQVKTWMNRISILVQQVLELIKMAWDEIKEKQRKVYEPKKMSLDDLIGGAEKIKEKQIQSNGERTNLVKKYSKTDSLEDR